MTDMTKRRLVIASAAALFAAGALPAMASAEDRVKCAGINSCKGTSACKTASSSCKGQYSCKGLGWSEVGSESECTSKGGKVI